ncbi:MAG: D-alanine--D-alanine ligase, partial [Bacteroidetes bacterium]|nr:D-alanine--D-alanine ligase [Bacteroidota bacterium]
IPYSGSGIFSSAIGISKAVQKELMQKAGFAVNKFTTFTRTEYDNSPNECFSRVKEKLHFPVVIKSSSQGSSIGVHFLKVEDESEFRRIVNSSFFRVSLAGSEWNSKSESEKVEWVRKTTDLQHGLGCPMLLNNKLVLTPDDLLEELDNACSNGLSAQLESIYAETEIVVEEMLHGKEFSCIVVRDTNNEVVALPPTEIRKSTSLFDYRAKYLPGITRKITPIEIPDEHINAIRKQCAELYKSFRFNVYARIDGFVDAEGNVFLNDPNTTSGMMPSSFFFHQAAEIGLNPSQFLTYIIYQSLNERIATAFQPTAYKPLLEKLQNQLSQAENVNKQLPKVGVLFGGYSSERHISVESGRNVFEKLSSSGKYQPVPIFLTRDNDENLRLYKVPVNIMLKDNADDIKEKIEQFKIKPIQQAIINESEALTKLFADADYDFFPKEIAVEDLKCEIDFAFMALHGRPGEDGSLSRILEQYQIPYNGSGPASAGLTIDKFETNEKLRANGILVADHKMYFKSEWQIDSNAFVKQIANEFNFPLISKPADDGCSSAVKKIDTIEELASYCKAIFRETAPLTEQMCQELHLKANEEFPLKQGILVESLIGKNGAARFLEITGGMLSKVKPDGSMEFEVFEASEAVAGEGILSLEEKFLAGQGQNLTPARYADNPIDNAKISAIVKEELRKTATIANVEGYCRIDAFVRIFTPENVEVVVIEINSLPGLTPATAIFHQAALAGYKPFEFLEGIIEYGISKNKELARV